MEENKITIVTHNGVFHPDDVFGVATVLLWLEKNNKDLNNVEIVRTRQKEIIEKADYVIDVGGVYDEDNNRFDHHQTEGAGVRPNGIPYASFGLVWKKFGNELCGDTVVFQSIDLKIVISADALDCGVDITNNVLGDVEVYTIYDFITAHNISWKEKDFSSDERFIHVLNIAKDCIKREIILIKDKIEASVIVEKLYEESKDKRLVIMDKYYPWNDTLKNHKETMLVVYPSSNNEYNIQVVSDKKFESRIYFPKDWAGKTEGDFERITGVEGVIFCHKDLWFASTKSKEAAIKLGEIVLGKL